MIIFTWSQNDDDDDDYDDDDVNEVHVTSAFVTCAKQSSKAAATAVREYVFGPITR